MPHGLANRRSDRGLGRIYVMISGIGYSIVGTAEESTDSPDGRLVNPGDALFRRRAAPPRSAVIPDPESTAARSDE
jgi:hypothetical protein